jgi:hypothetical protein
LRLATRLTGLAGRLRRSELASFRIEDLTETAGDIFARLRLKIDPEGPGRLIPLRHRSDPLTFPVRAHPRLDRSHRDHFRTALPRRRSARFVVPKALCADSVAWLVKRAVGRIGLKTMEYPGHSLLAGRAT